MSRLNSFEELECWKKSRKLNTKIYKITENIYFKNDHELRKQIRRASISISSNIAEGFERGTIKDFRRFLFFAKGSAGELRSQFYLLYDLKYLERKTFESLKKNVVEISKMISGLINYLEKKIETEKVSK